MLKVWTSFYPIINKMIKNKKISVTLPCYQQMTHLMSFDTKCPSYFAYMDRNSRQSQKAFHE